MIGYGNMGKGDEEKLEVNGVVSWCFFNLSCVFFYCVIFDWIMVMFCIYSMCLFIVMIFV